MRTNGYATIILDIEVLDSIFKHKFLDICEEFVIDIEDHERIYDWCVMKAFGRVVNLKFGVRYSDIDFVDNDLYDIIYRTYFADDFEDFIHDLLDTWKIVVEPGQVVKAMVVGDHMYIARRNQYAKV